MSYMVHKNSKCTNHTEVLLGNCSCEKKKKKKKRKKKKNNFTVCALPKFSVKAGLLRRNQDSSTKQQQRLYSSNKHCSRKETAGKAAQTVVYASVTSFKTVLS